MHLQPSEESYTAYLKPIQVLLHLSLALIKTASSSGFNFYFCRAPRLSCTINAT